MVITKTVTTAPTMIVMVINAITSLKERSGSSRQAIKKFVIANYKLKDDNMLRGRLALALKKMIKDERLSTVKGSFKISKDAKKAITKVPKTKNKVSVQKKDKKMVKTTAVKKDKKVVKNVKKIVVKPVDKKAKKLPVKQKAVKGKEAALKKSAKVKAVKKSIQK